MAVFTCKTCGAIEEISVTSTILEKTNKGKFVEAHKDNPVVWWTCSDCGTDQISIAVPREFL